MRPRAKHSCTEELGLHAVVETHRIEHLSTSAPRQWLTALIPRPGLHLPRLSGLVTLNARLVRPEAKRAPRPPFVLTFCRVSADLAALILHTIGYAPPSFRSFTGDRVARFRRLEFILSASCTLSAGGAEVLASFPQVSFNSSLNH